MTQRVLLLLFVASSAAAQSRPGLTFDQFVRAGTAGDTTTTLIHMTAAGTSLRMEFENGPPPGQFKGVPLGNHGIMMMRDAGAEMIMMDPDKKEYMSIKPFEMMEQARKMMESMGGSMTFDTSASSIHLDSLGPGPVIEGHATIRYRMTARTKMNATMMGQTQTVETQMTWESQNALDFNEFDDVVGATSGWKLMAQSMSLPKDFFEKAMSKEHKMRGFPLHSERQMTLTANGTVRTTSETIDTKNIRRTSVPDSAFAVPADYKQIALPFGPPLPTP